MRVSLMILILTVIMIGLFIRHLRTISDLHYLSRQLEEIGRGSQIELCVQSRQPRILALCRQLNALFGQFSGRYQQYEKTQQQLKQNITGLAHDIRTPLTGAAGYVQLAQECKDPDRQERYLQTALDRMNELSDMLEELFLYTKLTSEDFEPDMREIQALPLLSDCLVGMYRQFEEKGVSPEVDFSSEGFRICADEECLRRIFHNLIRNALLHGEGPLEIRQSGNRLIFENRVSETGRPDPEQIFDRFYKADTARRKGSSGLGLFIVKELAQKMGASVKAQLNGEKFRIILEFRVL